MHSSALTEAAEIIELQTKVAGSDLCARVENLSVESTKASMQFIVSIDFFDGEALQYNTIQYNTIDVNTIDVDTIQYNTIQCNTIEYN